MMRLKDCRQDTDFIDLGMSELRERNDTPFWRCQAALQLKTNTTRHEIHAKGRSSEQGSHLSSSVVESPLLRLIFVHVRELKLLKLLLQLAKRFLQLHHLVIPTISCSQQNEREPRHTGGSAEDSHRTGLSPWVTWTHVMGLILRFNAVVHGEHCQQFFTQEQKLRTEQSTSACGCCE